MSIAGEVPSARERPGAGPETRPRPAPARPDPGFPPQRPDAGTALPTASRLAFLHVHDKRLLAFVREVCGSGRLALHGHNGPTLAVQASVRLGPFKMRGPAGTAVLELVVPDESSSPTPLETALPVLTHERVDLMQFVVTDPNTWTILAGRRDPYGPMLSLANSGVTRLAGDLPSLARCLSALLPPDYRGDARDEVGDMLRRATRIWGGYTHRVFRPYDPGSFGPLALGFTKAGSYALLDRARQVVILCSANQLCSPQFLTTLMTSEWWWVRFPRRRGFDAQAAGEGIVAACKEKGLFDPSRVRGRGVWRENHRVVVNLGEGAQSKTHLYLRGGRVQLTSDPTFDAPPLLRRLQLFSWRDPQQALLLFGAIALGPACGTLPWRVHSLISGPRGSGKTTVAAIARSVLTPLVVAADGRSSEAGVRNAIGPDALPVVMEVEADPRNAGLRRAVRLARSAQPDTPELKATADGTPVTFNLAANLLFTATSTRGLSRTDRSNFVELELVPHADDAATARAIADEEEFFRNTGPAFCARMIGVAADISTAAEGMVAVVAGETGWNGGRDRRCWAPPSLRCMGVCRGPGSQRFGSDP